MEGRVECKSVQLMYVSCPTCLMTLSEACAASLILPFPKSVARFPCETHAVYIFLMVQGLCVALGQRLKVLAATAMARNEKSAIAI